jgi:hypothetical protein
MHEDVTPPFVTAPSGQTPILLFYQEFERDKFIKYDRYLKRVFRPLYNLMHHRQKMTGFAVSFELMVRALRKQGFTVRINPRTFIVRSPDACSGFDEGSSVSDLPRSRTMDLRYVPAGLRQYLRPLACWY